MKSQKFIFYFFLKPHQARPVYQPTSETDSWGVALYLQKAWWFLLCSFKRPVGFYLLAVVGKNQKAQVRDRDQNTKQQREKLI
jgi:hypothetical protein